MPDMPAAFYVPAFTALIGAMGFLVGLGRELWKVHRQDVERTIEQTAKSTEALNASSSGIREQTRALDELRVVVEELERTSRAAAGLPAAPTRRPRRG